MEYFQFQGCGFQIVYGNFGVGVVERRCFYLYIESYILDKVLVNGICWLCWGFLKGWLSFWGELVSGWKMFFVLFCWVCFVVWVEQLMSEYVYENYKKIESFFELGYV